MEVIAHTVKCQYCLRRNCNELCIIDQPFIYPLTIPEEQCPLCYQIKQKISTIICFVCIEDYYSVKYNKPLDREIYDNFIGAVLSEFSDFRNSPITY